ncbi:YajG family lipoprotein [Parashewanella tropica]|uniref:YajG family lipoprotein n=1 Tax=Parashewanella tropica TaxID=2547970 RepID=UPI0010596894|nr:YajG family lipoprotein [Parashewanella tropica]
MKTRALLFMLSMTLAGCASKAPTQIVLSPSVPHLSSVQTGISAISLQVVDRRQANFIVRQDSSATENHLVAPAVPPSKLISQVLTQAFENQHIAVTPQAPIRLTIYIDDLLADVIQESFEYQVSSKVILSLEAVKGIHSFKKRYQVTGSLSGSLQLDYSQLELELNKLIDQITSDVLNDSELNEFMASSTK